MPDKRGYIVYYSRNLFQKLNQIRLDTRSRNREYKGAIREAFNPPAIKVGEISCASRIDENAPYIPMYL